MHEKVRHITTVALQPMQGPVTPLEIWRGQNKVVCLDLVSVANPQQSGRERNVVGFWSEHASNTPPLARKGSSWAYAKRRR